MTVEVPAEMVRLLGILAGCHDGATQDELTTIHGVRGSLELWAKVGDGIGGKAAYRGGA